MTIKAMEGQWANRLTEEVGVSLNWADLVFVFSTTGTLYKYSTVALVTSEFPLPL